jgi:hypothetical protein
MALYNDSLEAIRCHIETKGGLDGRLADAAAIGDRLLLLDLLDETAKLLEQMTKMRDKISSLLENNDKTTSSNARTLQRIADEIADALA